MKHPDHRCLICWQPLPEGGDFHPACSTHFFGKATPPELPYRRDELNDLAKNIVRQSIAVPGVQPKLSLAMQNTGVAGSQRLTLTGVLGDFILKPPHDQYPELPENEFVTMHLARIFGISTVPFGLIRLLSGERSYITRRVDRMKGRKLPMEDFCQLTERLTEYKYRGSLEQVAKTIRRFSSYQGIDVLRFFELAAVSFMTGNADMHLKNFSMLTHSDGRVQLSPSYDLVATKLAMPADPEESALTLNGKKRKLNLVDFQAFAQTIGISEKVQTTTWKKLSKALPKAFEFIQSSPLSEHLKQEYVDLLTERSIRMELISSSKH